MKKLFEKKRFQSLCAAVLTFAQLVSMAGPPLAAAAAAVDGGSVLYGDVNKDSFVDNTDVELLARYLAEDTAVTIDLSAADLDTNGVVELNDLLYLVKSTKGENLTLGENVTVSFDTGGGNAIDPVTLIMGGTMSMPEAEKKNAVFLGWYKDPALQEPFYGSDPILEDVTLYAKYQEVEPVTEYTPSAFALRDQSPDVAFDVERISGTLSPENAVTVLSVDGSAIPKLVFTSDGANRWKVTAEGGYQEGASYQMILADGYRFVGKEDSIRKASFYIFKEEIVNFTTNADIIYIRDTESMTYTLSDGTVSEMISEAVLYNSEDIVTGSFSYSGASGIQAGDTLCIYANTHPNDRDYINGNYDNDPASYIVVESVSGNEVKFRGMTMQGENTDVDKLISLPSTIPFSVVTLPQGDGSVEFASHDTAALYSMYGAGAPTEAKVGDFLVFYRGAFGAIREDDPVSYKKVTAVDGGKLTYIASSQDELTNAVNLFLKDSVEGDAMMESVDPALLEAEVMQQVAESNFAEDAMEYLAAAFSDSEEFYSYVEDNNITIYDENGVEITEEQLRAYGLGHSFELTDDIELSFNITKCDGKNTHFKDGLAATLTIGAEFEVDVGKGGNMGSLKIELAAAFTQEVMIDVSINANADITWYVFVPVIHDIVFSSSVDAMSYTGVSVEAKMYTQEPSEDFFDKLEENWGSKLGKANLQKIKNFKQKYEKVFGEDSLGDDIEGFWEEQSRLITEIVKSGDLTEEELISCMETTSELNVLQTFFNSANLMNDEEYGAGVTELVDRYSEMLEEGDNGWLELCKIRLFEIPINLYLFQINIEANFVVRANVNIALGASIEYEIGKRYVNWFSIFGKGSGSEEIDLIDERFAFQFYAMGHIGLRVGILLEVQVGVISTKIGYVGISAEFGAYADLYGYFQYTYTKYRPAGGKKWDIEESMMGALYFEFGLYLDINLNASLLGILEKSWQVYEGQWVLLTAGQKQNIYDFATEVKDDETYLVQDEDANSNTGIIGELTETYRSMKAVDMTSGKKDTPVKPWISYYGYDFWSGDGFSLTDGGKDKTNFHYTLSSKYFTLEPIYTEKDGKQQLTDYKIHVDVPEGIHYLTCDLRMVWCLDKLCWSKYDIDLTVPLVWTDLSEEELKQYKTATVKVGNENDGYTTVWTDRYLKGETFELPDTEKILDLAGYAGADDVQYSGYTGYTVTSRGETINSMEQSITFDTIYYFDMTLRQYSITVAGVQNADGSVATSQFTAKYGEAFDFSALEKTGTDKPDTYTRFAGIQAVDAKGTETLRNVKEPIRGNFARELLDGSAAYHANYTDNSTAVTYKFAGLPLEPIQKKYKIGMVANQTDFMAAIQAAEPSAYVSSVTPAFSEILGDTVYTVDITIPPIPLASYTITYNTNGGSAIASADYMERSVISAPQAPVREGFTFAGWYCDEACTQSMDWSQTMPAMNFTLYAKWNGTPYTVTFDAGEGTVDTATKEVMFGDKMGELPVAKRENFNFVGWFDAKTGGNQYTADTVYNVSGKLTLHAQWKQKDSIASTDIELPLETLTYDGAAHKPVINFKEGLGPASFTVSYKRQILDRNWSTSLPVNAGTYDIRIQRAEDNLYQAFDYSYTGRLVIEKKARTITAEGLTGEVYYANIMAVTIPEYEGDGVPMYAVEKYSEQYNILKPSEPTVTWTRGDWQSSAGFMNLKAGKYRLCFYVAEGENYLATNEVVLETEFTVEAIGRTDWTSNVEFYLETKTSGAAWSDTTGAVYAQFVMWDGSLGSKVQVSNTRWLGKTGKDKLPWPVDPWQPKAIRYSTSSTNDWQCAGDILLSAKYGGINRASTYDFVFRLSSNKSFWVSDGSYDVSLPDLRRHIFNVGDFDSPVELKLRGNNGVYQYIFDGIIRDDYCVNGELIDVENYNCYAHTHAPTMTITLENPTVNGHDYTQFFRCGIRDVTIDRDALYQAMIRDGLKTITATATLTFDTESTREGNEWTKTFTITQVGSTKTVSEELPTYDAGSIDGDVTIETSEENDRVRVTVGLDKNSGIWGVKNTIGFDPGVLRLMEDEKGNLRSSYKIVTSKTDVGYTFVAYRDSARESYETGTFVTLTFQKLKADADLTKAIWLDSDKVISDLGQLPKYTSRFQIGEFTEAPSEDNNSYTSDEARIVEAIAKHLEGRRTDDLTLYYTSKTVVTEKTISDWFHSAKETLNSYDQFGIQSFHAAMSKYSRSDTIYHTVTYRMDYYTTQEQEQKFEDTLQNVISQLNVSGKNDFQKILEAYRYVCEHVTYDEEADHRFTAYGALVEGKAVCQGYSLLLMRMLQELGIESDVVFGVAQDVNHMWNTAYLDGEYFLLDATWDSQSETGCYQWFLNGTDTFDYHSPDEKYADNVSNDDHVDAFAASHVLSGDDKDCTTADICSRCKVTFEAETEHAFTNGCDPDCNNPGCSYTRSVSHKDDDQDHFCDICGENQSAPRLAGETRYETSFAIANELKKVLGVAKFDTVILANSDKFADALGGSYLAAAMDAPILIGNQKHAAEVCSYVNQNLSKDGTVYILGGQNAMPDSILTGITVTDNFLRLEGIDRYETNLAILKEVPIGSSDLLVTTGRNFADSLSASATGLPILLINSTDDSRLSEEQMEFLATVEGDVYILGGPNAVNDVLKTEIENIVGKESPRISGATRYETSVNIAEHFFPDARQAVVAYGGNFPDGLCGGPLAYHICAPLILTKDGNHIAPDYHYEKGISSGYILGGERLISDSFVAELFK